MLNNRSTDCVQVHFGYHPYSEGEQYTVHARINGKYWGWHRAMKLEKAVAFAIGIRDEALTRKHYMQVILPEGVQIPDAIAEDRINVLKQVEAVH